MKQTLQDSLRILSNKKLRTGLLASLFGRFEAPRCSPTTWIPCSFEAPRWFLTSGD